LCRTSKVFFAFINIITQKQMLMSLLGLYDDKLWFYQYIFLIFGRLNLFTAMKEDGVWIVYNMHHFQSILSVELNGETRYLTDTPIITSDPNLLNLVLQGLNEVHFQHQSLRMLHWLLLLLVREGSWSRVWTVACSFFPLKRFPGFSLNKKTLPNLFQFYLHFCVSMGQQFIILRVKISGLNCFLFYASFYND